MDQNQLRHFIQRSIEPSPPIHVLTIFPLDLGAGGVSFHGTVLVILAFGTVEAGKTHHLNHVNGVLRHFAVHRYLHLR